MAKRMVAGLMAGLIPSLLSAEPIGPIHLKLDESKVEAKRLGPEPAASRAVIDTSMFPRPERLEPAVRFWTQVFSHYSEDQVLVHSMDYPHKVFTVLDFSEDAERIDDPRALRRHRIRTEQAAKERVDELLAEVQALVDKPEAMNAEQKRIYELLRDLDDPQIYGKQVGRIRGQRGLRERTQLALGRAGAYWEEIESTFARYELPLALTRLPIVESSFNVEAYSKVGAAGLWQFIPSSARIYMVLDDLRDERRDPWASTEAAARHLTQDYAELQDWPLAVTAYNYGRAGLRRALKETGGSTLFDLMDRYENRRFGFASRNFYAEFLAAVDVERAWQQYYEQIDLHEPVRYEEVQVAHYVPYATAQRLSGADAQTFRRLNPSWRDEVVDGKLYLVPGSRLRVPPGQAKPFFAGYQALGADELFSTQREYWRWHTIRRGESLSSIARRNGTSARYLAKLNGIRDLHLIRIGQKIKIPPRKDYPVVAVDRVREPKTHKVRKGQTLWGIARSYKVSVKSLLEANQLADASLLRAGASLRIPAH